LKDVCVCRDGDSRR